MALAGVPQVDIVPGKRVTDSWYGWFLALKAAFDGRFRSGHGSPQGVVVARLGTLYTDENGGAGATLWVKEANDGLATGWVAK